MVCCKECLMAILRLENKENVPLNEEVHSISFNRRRRPRLQLMQTICANFSFGSREGERQPTGLDSQSRSFVALPICHCPQTNRRMNRGQERQTQQQNRYDPLDNTVSVLRRHLVAARTISYIGVSIITMRTQT